MKDKKHKIVWNNEIFYLNENEFEKFKKFRRDREEKFAKERLGFVK